MAYPDSMSGDISRFLSSQRRPAPGRISEEAYNAGVDANSDVIRDRYPVKPVNEPMPATVEEQVLGSGEDYNFTPPQPSVPMPPPYQEPQIVDDSAYGMYQSGKGRGQQANPYQAPRPYNPYAGTARMAPNYFGNQSDVFGRPSYMYGSPQRSPYAPQQPMKGGNPYQRPQQPMKGGARPSFQMSGGFNPYMGGYQPQPQKGGSPYRNQAFGGNFGNDMIGSGPVDPMRAMTDPRYRFQDPVRPDPTLGDGIPQPAPVLTGGVTPLPVDDPAVGQPITGGPTPPPLGFDPTVAPDIDQTQNYMSNDNVSPNKGGGSQRYNPYQGTGYNPNSGKGGTM